MDSGSLTLLIAPEGDLSESSLRPKELKVGESMTVPLGHLHTFKVGNLETKTTVTLEPGSVSFERAILIIQGTQKDGTYQEFGAPTPKSMPLLAVLGELTDTNTVGEVRKHLDRLYVERGGEIREKKKELVEKYATNKHLEKASILNYG